MQSCLWKNAPMNLVWSWELRNKNRVGEEFEISENLKGVGEIIRPKVHFDVLLVEEEDSGWKNGDVKVRNVNGNSICVYCKNFRHFWKWTLCFSKLGVNLINLRSSHWPDTKSHDIVQLKTNWLGTLAKTNNNNFIDCRSDRIVHFFFGEEDWEGVHQNPFSIGLGEPNTRGLDASKNKACASQAGRMALG